MLGWLVALAMADPPPISDDPPPADPSTVPPSAPPAGPAGTETPPPDGKKPKKPKRPDPKWTGAGLPVANYSSDTGVGYGAFAAVVRTAPPGSDDPYLVRLALQLFWTTKQYQDHNLTFDFPSVFGSPYRIDGLVGYERWKQSNYYGPGNMTPRLPEDEVPDMGDLPQEAYYQYDVSWFRGLVNVRRQMGAKGDPWYLFGNYLLRMAAVNVYPGSLLDEQRPVGVEGGRYGRLSVGVMYDSRDAEPSPHKGTFSELSVRLASPVLGSTWTDYGVNLTDRHWLSIDKGGRVVIATREIIDVSGGEQPFFMGHTLGGSRFIEVGGANNLRGLPNGRYRGDAFVLWTPELRVTALKHLPLDTDILLCPFFDIGRVFVWDDNKTYAPLSESAPERGLDTPLHLHYSGGLGLRIQVGSAMLVRADLAFGREEVMPACPPGADCALVVKGESRTGFYLVFDHPY
jgi:hypothetical protein